MYICDNSSLNSSKS